MLKRWNICVARVLAAFSPAQVARAEAAANAFVVGDSVAANCTTNFTVVKVDVAINSTLEVIEESEGASELVLESQTTVGCSNGVDRVLVDVSPLDAVRGDACSIEFPDGCLLTIEDGRYVAAVHEYKVGDANLFWLVPRVSTGEVSVVHLGSGARDRACFCASDYSFTLFVDQPGNGGTRDAYKLSPFDVGHAFWRLNTSQASAAFEERFRQYLNVPMGFYPSSKPSKSEDEVGKLRIPDNLHLEKVDVVRTWAVFSNSFISALAFCNAFETNALKGVLLYNLSTNNCANAAIDAAGACGIILPRTTGCWTGGRGLNPGDLGEDIREMP